MKKEEKRVKIKEIKRKMINKLDLSKKHKLT